MDGGAKQNLPWGSTRKCLYESKSKYETFREKIYLSARFNICSPFSFNFFYSLELLSGAKVETKWFCHCPPPTLLIHSYNKTTADGKFKINNLR